VAKLYGLDAEGINQALGSAGTQAAGLWEFLRDAADSKQLHTAKAAADGLQSAWLARAGFTGARRSWKARRAWQRGCPATPIRRR
jgi:2-methylcitrate dehydratase PrpD